MGCATWLSLAVGKLDNLAAKLGTYRSNAYPHGLTHSQVVHNGIIENYVLLRQSVSTPFLGQTDSEVIVHLFETHFAARGNAPEVA